MFMNIDENDNGIIDSEELTNIIDRKVIPIDLTELEKNEFKSLKDWMQGHTSYQINLK